MSCPADDFFRTILNCPSDDLSFVAFDGQNLILLSDGQFSIVRGTILNCPSDDLSFVAFDGQIFIRCFTATFTYHRLQ